MSMKSLGAAVGQLASAIGGSKSAAPKTPKSSKSQSKSNATNTSQANTIENSRQKAGEEREVKGGILEKKQELKQKQDQLEQAKELEKKEKEGKKKLDITKLFPQAQEEIKGKTLHQMAYSAYGYAVAHHQYRQNARLGNSIALDAAIDGKKFSSDSSGGTKLVAKGVRGNGRNS